MLARTPRISIAIAVDPKRQALNRDKQRTIRGIVAMMMRSAEPTPFAVEGPARAGIRSALCLQGWRWSTADRVAAELVELSLRSVGAARPTWKQGQPEWTQDGVMAVQYEYCRNCFTPLPEGHFKFCCKLCSTAYAHKRAYQHMSEDQRLHELARQAAWRNARREERAPRACECCGDSFKPNHADQKFCGQTCAGRFHGGPAR